jgi:hypothetical protein
VGAPERALQALSEANAGDGDASDAAPPGNGPMVADPSAAPERAGGVINALEPIRALDVTNVALRGLVARAISHGRFLSL